MKSLPFFIAYRYLFKTAYEQNIGTMVIVSFLGVMIGAFALTLVAAITKGFETEIHRKIQGVHSQIIVRSSKDPLDFKSLQPLLKNEFPEIAHVSPSSIKYGIIRGDDDSNDTVVVSIKAIDPEMDVKVTSFFEKIIDKKKGKKKKELIELLGDEQVIIGIGVADSLRVSVGDEIELLFPEDTQKKSKKVSFNSQKATVSGIFKTGIDDIDMGMIVCSFSFFDELFSDAGIDQVNIKLHAGTSEKDVIRRLTQRTDLDVYSWKDLYPALVSALALEKYVSFAILALVALVASMNMISLIFMLITQKRADIAILKACGAADHTISLIFILFGMIITSSAAVSGLFLASLISSFLRNHPFIPLPDAYLVSHLPADLTFSIVLAVFAVVLMLGFFATRLPVRRIRSLNVAEVLRFEA